MTKEKIQNHFKGNYKAFYEKFLEDIKKDGAGDEFKALCPFHDDNDPSFNFNDQDGKYYCHGCKLGGDIFHFYGKVNDLSIKHDFGKILEGIADDFGIAYEETKKRIGESPDMGDTFVYAFCSHEKGIEGLIWV